MNCHRCGRETMAFAPCSAPAPGRVFRMAQLPVCSDCLGKYYSKRGVLLAQGKVSGRSKIKPADRGPVRASVVVPTVSPRRESHRPPSVKESGLSRRSPLMRKLARWTGH